MCATEIYEVGLNGNYDAQKRKEKAQQQIQSFAAKFRKLP